ncbi:MULTISPECIES: 50S ribosomal protein L11 methyltransferase [Sphingomonas]|uniref:50S ribosomal protein L11 methyltransferase n=1 Tax=Sphingomonas TaxID=13687 RepID=UPI000DEEE1F3|nr:MULTISPECIES: 50S ribosomal protein L11 methyltransferase [Sphingomonas]
MSWRVTLPATRAQGEAVGSADELFPDRDSPPVIVADEPDEHRPDDWVIHAYFEERPDAEALAVLSGLASGPPRIEQLADENWVAKSQSGLEPIRAGRFFVHTPTAAPDPAAISFEIDAGLAFGTGQHATTKGCIEALDRLEREGRRFENIADIGTGTGLLAFAALRLWPAAKAIATDIDEIAVDVSRDNARINGIALGHGAGELLLTTADGMDSPLLSARAPFDLLIANILAGPLVELAPDFVGALRPGAWVVLAGLLDSQAEAVAAAYESRGCRLIDGGTGEWRILVLERSA